HGLAQAGADVCIWGTNSDRNEDAATELAKHGTRVLALCCDVGDEAAVRRSFSDTVEHFGRVDSCFVNAGVGSRGIPFLEIELEEFRRVTRINLEGAFLTLQAAARHMVERGGGGVLVGTASLAAVEGAPRGQHYAATKGGLVSMMKACAVELARHQVRAHALLPGWIDTPMAGPALHSDAFNAKVLPRVPARRWGTPEDFAAAAVYLASPATSYHTGDTMVIDGGYGIF
ncbi:MAG: SDR family oxidoreductase, partial [Pseudonocardiaceae bacterium]|nr:SDR family oxidoreductase [Pseudonocardiaceae bacterium]